MTFEQQILVTLLDKGLLALVLAVAGFSLNWLLQYRKARDETIRELASSRAEAYKQLYKLLAIIRPSEGGKIATAVRERLDLELTNWYHEESGALFMSWQTAQQFLLVLDMVRDDTSTDTKFRSEISKLRTRLKQDCGIYGFWEGRRQLPTPRRHLGQRMKMRQV